MSAVASFGPGHQNVGPGSARFVVVFVNVLQLQDVTTHGCGSQVMSVNGYSRSSVRRALYSAVSAKDPRFDGRFFVGVQTTGVFCRPICPSRTPRLENCVFFEDASSACG